MNHNFGFTTEAEILDAEGRVVRRISRDGDCPEKNTLGITVRDKDGRIVQLHEQPMKSFTIGMVEEFVAGYRLAVRNDTYAANPVMIGQGAGPTYVNNVGLNQPFAKYSAYSTVSGTMTSDQRPLSFDSVSSGTGVTEVRFHTSRSVISTPDGNPAAISEIALYSSSGKMLAREEITPAVTFGVGTTIELSWTLQFPSTQSKALNRNWIYNFIFELYGNNNQTIWDTGSVSHTLTTTSGRTWTAAEHCIGGTGTDTVGIVVGTSDQACSVNDTDLIERIASSSGGLHYLAMPSVSYVPAFSAANGKAYAVYLRDFVNHSGSAITIKEAGLITDGNTSSGCTGGSHSLLARWLTGTATVNPGETLRVYFKPSVVATPETQTSSDAIIQVTEEMRRLYPGLGRISMILKTPAEGLNWMQAKEHAHEVDAGGFTDWRLPELAGASDGGTGPDYELKAIAAAKNVLGLDIVNMFASNDFGFWSGHESGVGTAYYLRVLSHSPLPSSGNKINSSYALYVR